MTKQDVINQILGKNKSSDYYGTVTAFAPVNIALIKYWGKRNEILNLPVTDSLSISLTNLGTTTELSVNNNKDTVFLNDKKIDEHSDFFNRIVNFVDLFRPDPEFYFTVKTKNDIPTNAGLASSASGFCALTNALNKLFSWNLDHQHMSIIARLGSGSACRSIENGFVYWHAGKQQDGMDSYGETLSYKWSELTIGILTVSDKPKVISSRKAMSLTSKTSLLYKNWSERISHDLKSLLGSLKEKDMKRFGEITESNALSMHATMLDTKPPILYWLPETVQYMREIWNLRENGISVYFTIDAGPNIKLIFDKKDSNTIKKYFPEVKLINIW